MLWRRYGTHHYHQNLEYIYTSNTSGSSSTYFHIPDFTMDPNLVNSGYIVLKQFTDSNCTELSTYQFTKLGVCSRVSQFLAFMHVNYNPAEAGLISHVLIQYSDGDCSNPVSSQGANLPTSCDNGYEGTYMTDIPLLPNGMWSR